ncbi:hypothetical protein ACFWQC_01025 [Nocardioides sp. NPDC058538]|uniref:hypothetical protein n=1 Tax=Nocardioides sp. NPDC058538 TaxID=3346542 RepID=UPI00364DBBC6
MIRGQAFVDESKVKDYLLVSAVLAEEELAAARKLLRDLLLPGQPRLHMKQESDPRRRKILSAINELTPEVTLYRAPSLGRTELSRRAICLQRLVTDLHRHGHRALCIELDETLRRRDNQTLIEATKAADSRDWLTYRHEQARREPLLSIPDALAWAWPKGGDWRRRCDSLAVVVVDV